MSFDEEYDFTDGMSMAELKKLVHEMKWQIDSLKYQVGDLLKKIETLEGRGF